MHHLNRKVWRLLNQKREAFLVDRDKFAVGLGHSRGAVLRHRGGDQRAKSVGLRKSYHNRAGKKRSIAYRSSRLKARIASPSAAAAYSAA